MNHLKKTNFKIVLRRTKRIEFKCWKEKKKGRDKERRIEIERKDERRKNETKREKRK